MTTDTGDFEGIDIEVAGAIAKKLGLELQVDDMDFDAALLAALEYGKVRAAGLDVRLEQIKQAFLIGLATHRFQEAK